MKTHTTIRALTSSEVEQLVDWARIEGWNPGFSDAPALHAADREGFIGCFVDGQMAAAISAVRYGSNFGFIGLYIAQADFRGKGHGRKVWDAGMAHLDGRTIGLDGVPEQQSNYRSMGFEPAYETFRWSGGLAGSRDADVTAITDDLVAAILDYDQAFFPAERDTFLTAWLKPPRAAKVIIRDGNVCGYAVCRKCHDGYKVGPLFAQTVDDAQKLLSACAAEIGDETLHIDVPASQAEFSAYLAAHRFTKGFTTARMYRGPAPAVHMSGVFGITTLELG
ncbi:GNAT family N-acetyltransferase [Neorhizobium galegae]|uniref:GNAT family N-acetyltransferase n=1 Tax=Neorhizobium galegae TaxID=399 RepID=UPI00128237BF|nr:GNAT family N-acetyltransferase [Neorhizobium galegae]KAA9385349.1 GNAT family N-acetyltransferase [Neorhizobium galegae]MCM2499441.1 GNAT family N-acetyltransferase [Neorhizobium galegae]MCQ1774008.1 GNAT family N-acetyltransferase [Neorhizobium galegae]